MAEVKRKYYENGELRSEWFEINGIKDGVYKYYWRHIGHSLSINLTEQSQQI